jgi:AcrR family transcriptional regulator
MPRYKDAERDQAVSETRQLLLDAAAAAFASEGYVGANVNHIAQAAGFAKGTIYNYFPSKRALMHALIDEVAAEHAAYITARVGPETDPRRRLERFFEAGFAFVTENLARARAMVTVLYGPDAEFNAYLYRAYQPLFGFVAETIIGPGVAQGVFRPVDVAGTAGLVMTLYLGTGSQVDEAGRPWLDHRAVADFAWHALRALPDNG